jgi:hypothetical protein
MLASACLKFGGKIECGSRDIGGPYRVALRLESLFFAHEHSPDPSLRQVTIASACTAEIEGA